MYNPLVMGVLQCVAQRRNDCHGLLERKLATLQKLPYVGAVNVFHDEEIKRSVIVEALHVLRLSEVINGDDVWMREPSQRSRLAGESLRNPMDPSGGAGVS